MAAIVPDGQGITPENWERGQQIFLAALEQPAHQRHEYARLQCGADQPLWAVVSRLLAGHAVSEGLLGTTNCSTDAGDAADDSLRLPYMAGAYRLVERIGAGGMGAVYRAERADGQFEKRVAVKVMSGSGTTARAARRFLTERQILANLDHPHIARLLDGGVTADGQPYIVMEYVEGLPIDRYCRMRGLTIEETVRLFEKVCGAVEYAHRHSVVHRDLKPANLLVTADGAPKLLDFGISKLVHPETASDAPPTIDRSHALTPDYASPEQLMGRPATPASDVYSLGVLFYELLTGARPERTVSNPPQIQSTRRISRDLSAIVGKALARDPDSRYASAGELHEDLLRCLDLRPVAARPRGLLPGIGRLVSRYRWQAVAVLALAALAASGTFLIRRQARALGERRLETVRAVRSLFYDTDSRMSKLPQSAEARRLLVQQVLQHLAALEGEAGNDPALLYELARCYEQLAWSQGWSPYSVGDFRGALDSFQRALPLAVRAMRISGEQRKKELVANVYQGIAGTANWIGEYDTAYRLATEGQSLLRSQSRDFAINGREEFLTYNLLMLGTLRGETLAALGRIEEARSAWQESDQLTSQYLHQPPHAYQVLAAIISLKRDLADHYCTLGNSDIGMGYARSAGIWEKAYSQRQPDNPALTVQVEIVIGECDLAAHRTGPALAAFRRSASYYREQWKRDPKNLESGIRVVHYQCLEGQALLEDGQLQSAAGVFKHSLDLLGSLTGLQNSANAVNIRGQLLSGLAEAEWKQAERRPPLSPASLQHLELACENYRKGRAVLDQLESGGLWVGSRLASQQIEKALTACGAAPLKAARVN